MALLTPRFALIRGLLSGRCVDRNCLNELLVGQPTSMECRDHGNRQHAEQPEVGHCMMEDEMVNAASHEQE